MDVIAKDYAIHQITDKSWADDTQITNYLSLFIDVHGFEDTVAFTAPGLIQILSKGTTARQIKGFITNLKPTTVKLFILICVNSHWTFFYFNKTSATMNYYDPLNGGSPAKYLIEIGRFIITQAFGINEIHFRIIKVPAFLQQKDGFNCGFYCIFYIIKLIKNESLAESLNFNITQIRNNIKEILEEITEKFEIPYEKFGIIKSMSSLQNKDTQENIIESDNEKNDTVMLYKTPSAKGELLPVLSTSHLAEQKLSPPKEPLLISSMQIFDNYKGDILKHPKNLPNVETVNSKITKTIPLVQKNEKFENVLSNNGKQNPQTHFKSSNVKI
uniref:Ubiquitin-like protease family profile domain-containing protein n=1 Tax=Panagrolaimus superbus TaxID=310955 RepID=A0A914YA43_9BILA